MTYGIPPDRVARYTCFKTQTLDDAAWQRAPKSPRFVDMVTGEPGYFDTRAAALWDDANLYVKFWIQEPFPEARLTARDSLVFFENDVEVFIDGGDCYYELEINALGTLYEVFYIWQDAYPGRFSAPEFDVVRRRALSFGGDYERTAKNFWRGNHPRGARWTFTDWDFPGLKASVRVDGKLNDRSVVSEGWTVDLAFPWSGMKWLAGGRSIPPRNGDLWRIFFGRFEKMHTAGVEIKPHLPWVWSPHGVLDTHVPECFPLIQFSI